MNVTQLLGYQPTIYADDGHGYDPITGVATPGKRTPKLPNGTVIYENQFNSGVAKRFAAAAIDAGFRVIYVAPTDIDTPLTERTDKANADFKLQKAKYPQVPEDKLAIYISFHFNALNGVFDGKAGGVETFNYPGSVAGRKLAEHLQTELMKGTKQVDRKVKSADFHVLRETHMTAALIECGFMDKLEEANLMLSPAFQQETAIDALRGVCAYLGLKYEAPFVPAKVDLNQWKKDAMEFLKTEGLTASEHDPDSPVTWSELGIILKKMKGVK